MTEDTGQTPVRVSLSMARDSAVRLRKALEHLDIPLDDIRQVIPASDVNGGHYVRMGTWNSDSAQALADGIEGLAEALETIEALTPAPPLIGRADGPSLLPPVL